MYSVKAVSRATGLSPETLRAWERRYKVVVPSRDKSGRRIYSQDEVARLRLLREAVGLGHQISRIAGFTDDELRKVIADSAPRTPAHDARESVSRLIRAVEEFDTAGCDRILSAGMATLPPLTFIQELLAPALKEVGERWHRGQLTIAQERLLTSAISRLLTSVIHLYQRSADAPGLLFATLSGERHELGSLLCALLAAGRGFRCHYLGADLPGEEIARMAEHQQAAVVALGLVMVEHPAEIASELGTLRERLPDHTRLWVGGSGAVTLARTQRLPAGCTLIEDAGEFDRRLDSVT